MDYLDVGRFVGDRVDDLFHRVTNESDGGPRNGGQHRGPYDGQQEYPHLLDGYLMVSRVALGEEGMAVRIVPYAKRSVEQFTPDREVNELDHAVREEEHGDGVRGEIVHVFALHH